MVVLVTGANGQLGSCLAQIASQYPNIQWIFTNQMQLDITNVAQCEHFFKQYQPKYCINTAAYTAVDKAEIETEKAYAINVTGVANLAQSCQTHKCTLIHISTDFVFDGKAQKPYTETDKTNPLGVYGITKRQGEERIEQVLNNYYIIRTSWLYSAYGNNFVKTILRLASEKPELRIINDQTGTPTHALDLANAIIQLLHKSIPYGCYHFSNQGQCTWFEFARKILQINQLNTPIYPIPTLDFPTPAQRPQYSVMDKSKIQQYLQISIPNWDVRLQEHFTE